MSKHETPMTLAFWQHCANGALMEEYRLVSKAADRSPRYADAIILPDMPMQRYQRGQHIDVKGKNIIVVQAKARRIGMYLMGQALFSARLAIQLGATSVRSILLCTKSDRAMLPLLAPFPEVEVWTLDLSAGHEVPRRTK